MANNTMYPNGYNLRHGSGIGEDLQQETQLASVFQYINATDHLISQIDATADMMQICQNLEDCSSDEEECDDMLDHVDSELSRLC
jgi:hypothetical protein